MEPGQRIDAKYSVESVIGSGSFSEVYLVQGPTGRSALKLLKKDLSGETRLETVSDFKHEFATLKELNHPHIGRILDFGFDPDLKQYYFTTEFIEGKNLFEATFDRPIEDILELFVQTLRAFVYLHSYRVHHFDVKAANILVTATEGRFPSAGSGELNKRPDGGGGGRAGSPPALMVKVIDFGLASIDPGGKIIGTPSTMAPEIVAKQKPDGRADLYSLGVLFYSCLTRKNPFRGNDVAGTLRNQRELTPPPASHFRKEIPEYLDRILSRMLEKNPADRYQRAGEILREINFYSPKKFPLETKETLLSYLPEEGRLIGRKKEIKLFQKTLAKVSNPSFSEAFLFLLVCGDRGTGKSRLLKEFKSLSQLRGIPIQFLLDDIDRDDRFVALRRALARILFFERADRNPVLIVASARAIDGLPPSLKEILPKETLVRMDLGPFSPEELRDYVVSLTGIENPPASLLSGIQARTEGNPLLVTELLRSLIEGGALFDSAGRWQETTFEDLGVDFSKTRFSGVLEEIFLDRYKRLSPPLRGLMDRLAIAGTLTSGEAGPVLKELLAKDLVERTGTGAYRIKNETLAELIGRGMEVGERERLHDQAALLFSDDPEREAFHRMRGSDKKRALALARDKGDERLREARGYEAARFFQMALGLFRDGITDQDQEIELLLKLGEAHLISLDYPAALEALERVKTILAGSKGHPENIQVQVDVLLRIGAVYLKMGEIEKSRATLSEALGLLHFLQGDRVRELVAENLRGAILIQEGRLEEAKALLEGTRRIWEKELSREDRKKVTNNDLGVVYLLSQRHDLALEQFTSDLSLFETIGDRLLLARTHYHLGQTHLGLKDYAQAADHFQKTVSLAQPLKNTEFLLRAYNGLGNAFHLMKRHAEAIQYYERSVDLCERTGDLRSHAAILVNIGLIESEQGRDDQARRRLDPAISFLKSLKEPYAIDRQVLARALLEEGEIARRNKRSGDSERFLREALRISEEEEGAKDLRSWILSALGELKASGETDEKEKVREMEKKEVDSLKEKILEMSAKLERFESLAHVSLRGLETKYDYGPIVARSKPMQEIFRLLDKIVDTDLSVFIHGESGTGKELVARALHVNSGRGKNRFVAVNCGAIPANLIESELFGYKAGAFTGATRDKKGLFEEADGGTLFLDEVAEIELGLQAKLLRAVQEGEFYRVGDNRQIRTDVRIVSASNEDIERLVKEKRFRKDLFYRVCQIRVDLAPLRERREDIPLLVSHFIRQEAGKTMKVASRLMKAFLEYEWPGNIRELENVIKVAVALADGDAIEAKAIPSNYGVTRLLQKAGAVIAARAGKAGRFTANSGEIFSPEPPSCNFSAIPIDAKNSYDPAKSWYDYEKLIIAKAYQACRFRVPATSEVLGLSQATLYKKIKDIGLRKEDHPLYREPFEYDRQKKLKDYLKPVFRAALAHSGDKPYKAIGKLKVSQGYFYKVMK